MGPEHISDTMTSAENCALVQVCTVLIRSVKPFRQPVVLPPPIRKLKKPKTAQKCCIRRGLNNRQGACRGKTQTQEHTGEGHEGSGKEQKIILSLRKTPHTVHINYGLRPVFCIAGASASKL